MSVVGSVAVVPGRAVVSVVSLPWAWVGQVVRLVGGEVVAVSSVGRTTAMAAGANPLPGNVPVMEPLGEHSGSSSKSSKLSPSV